MPQETSRLSSRIKSKFSLQLLSASLCSVQIADLKILDKSKEAKSKKGGGGEMFWQPSSHQRNWRKPYHMNHLKIRSVWTQPWKMYRGEQACIGGGMKRMSNPAGLFHPWFLRAQSSRDLAGWAPAMPDCFKEHQQAVR